MDKTGEKKDISKLPWVKILAILNDKLGLQSHPNSLRNLHSLTLGGYEKAGAEKPTEGKRGGRTEAMFAKDILSLCSA